MFVEAALRSRIQASKFCEVRVGCEVAHIEQNDAGIEVEYTGQDGSAAQICADWLIGADGKRGTVRKDFLEHEAGIRHVYSDYRYEGTWVAANLRITIPTPQSHPDFPAWELGMTPEEVYDLFWPEGWHFCSPPGKPTATGRFGPHDQRLWRHEFRQDEWNEETMDAVALMWEHLCPMITRSEDLKGSVFRAATTFPRDCIEVLRCRPFTFTHKVANKWFHGKVVLIGDAAHVFPPFGGQGIASGIRDAHQLAWRIAVLQKIGYESPSRTEQVLEAWQKERMDSVRSAAYFTKMNGTLCNQSSPYLFWMMRIIDFFTVLFFGPLHKHDPQASNERAGFSGVSDGFLLTEHGGGVKIPQIYVDTIQTRDMLSDNIFRPVPTIFRLLVLIRANFSLKIGSRTIKDLLSECKVPDTILSLQSLAIMSTTPCMPESIGSFAFPTAQKFAPTPMKRLSSKQARPHYDVEAFAARMGRDITYAIVRPDFYVYAVAKDLNELRVCLGFLVAMLQSG